MKDRKEIEARLERLEAGFAVLANKVLTDEDERDELLQSIGPPTTGLSATKVTAVS